MDIVYIVQQRKMENKPVKTCSSVNTLSYKNSKLKTGKTYYYKVRAYVNKNGKKTLW